MCLQIPFFPPLYPEPLCKVGNARGAPVIGENRIDADFKEILKVNIQFGTCWQGHGA